MDGSGKSTNIASLIAALEAAGYRVTLVTFWDNVVVLPRFRSNVTAAVFQGETGIGSPEKPVGLVFHALASERDTEVVERNFFGDRKRVRWFASQQALDMLRRKLI